MAGFSSDGAIGHGGSPPLPCFFRGDGLEPDMPYAGKERAADEHGDTGHEGIPAMCQPQKHRRIQSHQRDNRVLRSGGKRTRNIPGDRGRNREDRQENMPQFHRPLHLQTSSLPAGITVAGATPHWGGVHVPPECNLKRGSRDARATKRWGRSRHSLPLWIGAQKGAQLDLTTSKCK